MKRDVRSSAQVGHGDLAPGCAAAGGAPRRGRCCARRHGCGPCRRAERFHTRRRRYGRKWTSHEARSAQARALEEKGNEYILPLKVDDTELDGLPPIIGYVPVSTGVDKIAEMLIAKLKG